ELLAAGECRGGVLGPQRCPATVGEGYRSRHREDGARGRATADGSVVGVAGCCHHGLALAREGDGVGCKQVDPVVSVWACTARRSLSASTVGWWRRVCSRPVRRPKRRALAVASS